MNRKEQAGMVPHINLEVVCGRTSSTCMPGVVPKKTTARWRWRAAGAQRITPPARSGVYLTGDPGLIVLCRR